MEAGTHPIESQVVSQRHMAYRSETRNSATISLKTQEGDTVDLSFNNTDSYAESASETKSRNGATVQTFSAEAMSAAKYSMSVQGALNESEMAAIKEMADALTPIAQNFFSGENLNLEDAAQSLAGSMEAIESVHVQLEQTMTESFAGVSRFSENDNVQPSTTAGEKPPPTGVTAPEKSKPGIRDPQALANAVVESVFQGVEKAAQDDPVLLRGLSDLMRYLQSKLSRLLKPLQSAGDQPPPEPNPTPPPEAEKVAATDKNAAVQ